MTVAPLPPERRLPAPSRLSPQDPRFDEVMAAHDRSVELGTYGYRDPVTGLLVFSAAYLWERGFCCDTGCRHCPYVGRPGAEDLVSRRRV
jgi:hypothetical protein